MNLFRMLQQRAAEHKPLRVGLIGAGKFGSMYLAQARHTPGIHVVAIADRYHQEPAKVAAIVLIGNLGSILFVPVGLILALQKT